LKCNVYCAKTASDIDRTPQSDTTPQRAKNQTHSKSSDGSLIESASDRLDASAGNANAQVTTGHAVQAVQTRQQTKHADSDDHQQDRKSTGLQTKRNLKPIRDRQQTDTEDTEFKRLTNIDMNDNETDDQPILMQYIHNEF